MKLINLSAGIILVLAFTFMYQCEELFENEEDEALVSEAGQSSSHRSGEACLSCHKSGGSGEGVFTVAGTVYTQDGQEYPDVQIVFATQPNLAGTQVTNLSADTRGNFFTTRDISGLSTGLYVSVISSNDTVNMSGKVNNTSGNCNSCHNQNDDGKIQLQ